MSNTMDSCVSFRNHFAVHRTPHPSDARKLAQGTGRYGVTFAKVDIYTLLLAVAATGIRITGDISTPDLVETYARWSLCNVLAEDHARCSTCGGWSDYRLECCPYCGNRAPVIEHQA